jgi:hypothetical protein
MIIVDRIEKPGGGEPIFRHIQKELMLSRVYAGFVWPGVNPGAVAVVGEEATVRRGEEPRLYLLHHFENHDEGELLRLSSEIEGPYAILNFYGRLDDTHMQFLSLWNRRRRDDHKREFHLYPAPFTSENGSIQHHLVVLRDSLKPERKVLILENEAIANLLQTFPVEEITRATDIDHPMLGALGYAVTALINTRPYDIEGMDQAETEYDILEYR